MFVIPPFLVFLLLHPSKDNINICLIFWKKLTRELCNSWQTLYFNFIVLKIFINIMFNHFQEILLLFILFFINNSYFFQCWILMIFMFKQNIREEGLFPFHLKAIKYLYSKIVWLWRKYDLWIMSSGLC